MATDWIMVRVSKATHARLLAVRESLFRAEENGQVSLDRDPRDRVSIDQIINRLIDARSAHAARRNKTRRTAQHQTAAVLPVPSAAQVTTAEPTAVEPVAVETVSQTVIDAVFTLNSQGRAVRSIARTLHAPERLVRRVLAGETGT
jgi:hypothetical protein